MEMKPAIRLKIDGSGLLNYSQQGKEALRRVKKAMQRILNAGRREARQAIASKFQVRTGRLKRDARRMQTKLKIKSYEIKGQVKPLPRLLNIFERGATLTIGRGILAPRPVVAPAHQAMEALAKKEFDQILSEVGK